MVEAIRNAIYLKRIDMKDAIQIEKWIFMILISVLGLLCSRELARLSSSIENLAKTQTDQLQLYQDLKLELRSFEIEMRARK
jgi:hypothetical protein